MKEKPFFAFFFLLLLIYTQMTGIVSAFFVEASGVYITETEKSYEFSGASFVYGLVLLLFLSLILTMSNFWFIVLSGLFYRCKEGAFLSYPNVNYHNLILFIVILTLLLHFLHIYISGIPAFNEHLTRFNFWQEFARYPILGKVFGELAIPVAVMLGLLYSFSFSKDIARKGIIVSAFVFYLFYLFLMGHKFNGFIVAISFFYAPILFKRYMSSKPLLTKVEVALFFSLLILMLFLSYVFFSSSSGGVIDEVGGNPVWAVFYRVFALQGYSWVGFWELMGSCDFRRYDSYMESAIYLLAERPDFYLVNGISLANIFPGILLCSPEYPWAVLLVKLFLLAMVISFFIALSATLFLKGSLLRTGLSFMVLFVLTASFPSGDYGEVQYLKVLGISLLILVMSAYRSIVKY